MFEQLREDFRIAMISGEQQPALSVDPGRPRTVAEDATRVFTLDNLDDLLALITPENDETFLTARYIVTAAKQILFALEGVQSSSVPDHSEMSLYALAAGNICFSKEAGNPIAKINNCSGHFKLAPASIVWPLAILKQNASERLNTTITIERANHTGEIDATLNCSLEEIDSLLPTNYTQQLEVRPTTFNTQFTPPRIRRTDMFFSTVSTNSNIAAANENVLPTNNMQQFAVIPATFNRGKKRRLSDMFFPTDNSDSNIHAADAANISTYEESFSAFRI